MDRRTEARTHGSTLAATSTPEVDPQARTSALVAQHGPALLRVAARVLVADDAHDAFQRAGIYLRRLETTDPLLRRLGCASSCATRRLPWASGALSSSDPPTSTRTSLTRSHELDGYFPVDASGLETMGIEPIALEPLTREQAEGR